jgi:hypothetical protein
MMMLVCLLRQKFKKLRFQMIDDIALDAHRSCGVPPRFRAEKGDFGLPLSPMIAGAQRFQLSEQY